MTSNSGSGAPSLGEMIVANALSGAVPPPAPPPTEAVIPAAASEASTRLAEIKADPAWRDAYLGGSPRHAKEMRDLQAAIDKGEDHAVDMAVNGVLYDGIQPSGHLAKVGTAQYLRDIGLGENEIRQGVTGSPVSREEHAAAVASKARLLEDADFIPKYSAGDPAAKRAMTRLNLIISGGIKGAAA